LRFFFCCCGAHSVVLAQSAFAPNIKEWFADKDTDADTD
jgi:hypothetical protein